MSEREIQKTISQIILSSFPLNLISGGSKLSRLQQIYQQQSLTFKQSISQSGRMLTKKIFGTAIRCVNKSDQSVQFVNSKNLVSLSLIFLNIIFLDEYVLKLVIEELNNGEQIALKMIENHNPYKEFDINGADLYKILIQIILKINSLRSIFSTSDILKDYYVASQTFSYFLRIILTKLKYKDADNLSIKLQNTCQMYSILSEYFDLNVIARNSYDIRKNNTLSAQINFGDKSQVYLFNNYNLFISTVDNEQFCCGRYYSNENQLFNSEKQIRKSTLQFILKCREAQQKQLKEESQEEGDKVQMRLSQFQMDLGASSSTMLGPKDGETPYFSSNAPTPQFGSLLQSTRFRKSIDFEVNNEVSQIKNPQSSPVAQSIKQSSFGFYMQKKQLKSSRNNFKNQENSFFKKYQLSTNLKFTPISFEKATKRKSTIQQDIQSQNKPRSPPSTQFKPRQQKEISQKRQSNGIYFDRIVSSQLKKELKTFEIQNNQQKMISKQNSNQLKLKNIMQFQDKNKIVIADYSQKSFQFNNAMYYQHLRLSSKSKEQKSLESINQFNSMWQQNYVNVEHHILQKQKRSKKKDLSSRKYSINEGKSNEKNTFVYKQKNQIHQSNHFRKAEQEYEQMVKSRKTGVNLNRKQLSINWQNQNSRSADGQRYPSSKSPRKMEFTSNIMNFQIVGRATQYQEKKQFQHKKFSPYKFQNRFLKQTTKVPNLKIDKAKLAALRKSKSSKSSRSPRIQSNSDWYEKMGLSKHFSQYTPHTPSTPKGNQEGNVIIKKVNQNMRVSPSSKLGKKYSQQETKQKYKEGKLTRTSKFPQFLRHAKSRKLAKNQKLQMKSKNQNQNNNNNFDQQNKTKLIIQNNEKHNFASQNQCQTFQETQFYERSKKNSVYVQSRAYTEEQEHPYSHSQRKLKHNLSQPHLLVISGTINVLSNDFHHRPWICGPKIGNSPGKLLINKQITNQILQNRQAFENTPAVNRPTFSSQYVNKQIANKNYNCNVFPRPTIQYSNIPQGFMGHKPILNKQPIYVTHYHHQNDLKRSWRTSGQAETLKQSSHTKFQQMPYREANFTTLNSTMLSKAESPSTQFSLENQLLLRNQNMRKQMWEQNILTKL